VSWWFKQDEIHAHTHVHGCPAFLPWHCEFVNRFEALLRRIDPQLSLHYWDWTTDPGTLFTPDFLGNAHGDVGELWLSAGFYNPDPSVQTRDSSPFNPADPPKRLTRDLGRSGALITAADDNRCINAADFPALDAAINIPHGEAHGYIGGTLTNAHTSFRDPVAFLVHSNVDRLFAVWQLKDPSTRLDPNQVYGADSNTTGSGDVANLDPTWGILSPLEPWAGPSAQTTATGIVLNVNAMRPWAAP
jgi:hypothetical protein